MSNFNTLAEGNSRTSRNQSPAPIHEGRYAKSEEDRWFVVRVKPRSEFRVSVELSDRGFDSLLPARQVQRRWCDRIKFIKEAVFPGYLFCRFDISERFRVLSTPSVIQVLGIGATPIPVSESEIHAIQLMVASRIGLSSWAYLQTGQKVRISSGPLAGIEATVVRSESDKPRVVVAVTLLQRSISAEIDREWIIAG